MRCLVAGCSGYIGSALTPYLCQLGHQVTAIDVGNLTVFRDACRFKNLKIAKVDCTNEVQLAPFIHDADVIYWLVGATSGSREFMQKVNADAALMLSQMLWPTQTVVFPMTNAGYVPVDGIAKEDMLMIGRTDYSYTKIQAEKALMATGQCVSFRLAAVYGPAPVIRWETLLNFMVLQAALKNTDQLYEPDAARDVIYTQDLMQRLVLPLVRDLRGEIFNLSGQSMSKLGFAQLVSSQTEFKIVYGAGVDTEKRDYIVSEEKIRREFPYLKTTPASVGIAATLKAARLEICSHDHGISRSRAG